MGSIVDPQDQALSFAFFQIRRNIELERSIASLVMAQQVSIQPRRGVPVAGADDQKNPLIRP